MRRAVGTVQHDRRDAWVITHGRGETVSNVLQDAGCVDVDHSPVSKGPVVGPDRGKVALGQAVFLRRRVGHVEVVAVDEAVRVADHLHRVTAAAGDGADPSKTRPSFVPSIARSFTSWG